MWTYHAQVPSEQPYHEQNNSQFQHISFSRGKLD
jgi:hypothetical protein